MCVKTFAVDHLESTITSRPTANACRRQREHSASCATGLWKVGQPAPRRWLIEQSTISTICKRHAPD